MVNNFKIHTKRSGRSRATVVKEKKKKKNEMENANKQLLEEQRITNKNKLLLIHLQLFVRCLPK